MSRLTHKVDGKYYPNLSNICGNEEYKGHFYRDVIHTKLGKLEDLEEELGCDLEVVFKVLIDGIFIEVEHLPEIVERPRLYYSDDFQCYCFELLFGEYVVKLKDYKKTWWLKGDKK